MRTVPLSCVLLVILGMLREASLAAYARAAAPQIKSCYAMLNYAIPFWQSLTLLHCNPLCCAVLCYAMLCHAVSYAVLCSMRSPAPAALQSFESLPLHCRPLSACKFLPKHSSLIQPLHKQSLKLFQVLLPAMVVMQFLSNLYKSRRYDCLFACPEVSSHI